MKSNILQEQFKKIFDSVGVNQEIHDFLIFAKKEYSLTKHSKALDHISHLESFFNLVDSTYLEFEKKINRDDSHLNQALPSNHKTNTDDLIELDSLLNTLDDGYLIIKRDNAKVELASSVAKKFLGKDPTGESLIDIISIPQEKKESFQDWLNLVFMEAIPFQQLARLAPKGFHFGIQNKIIDVKFRPIRHPKNNALTKIAMILHDQSDLFETEKLINEHRLFTDMVMKYLNDKPNFIRLIQATRETADTLNSWTFGSTGDVQDQSKILTDRLHHLKLELNNLSMYSLGYKIHQIEDEILTFFKINLNPQEGENLVHLLGQEIYDSLDGFLNKYRHIFIFDNKITYTKEIPVENIYKFCAELLRMGLTDLLDYYVDEIVAVPFASLFAPLEAKIYAQSISQSNNIEYHLSDPKKIRVIPEFYSYFFDQLNPIFNHIINHKNENENNNCKLEIHVDLSGEEKNKKILISAYYFFGSKINNPNDTAEKELLETLNQAVNHIGGLLEIKSEDEFSVSLNIHLPFVSEINSDLVNWISGGCSEIKVSLRPVS